MKDLADTLVLHLERKVELWINCPKCKTECKLDQEKDVMFTPTSKIHVFTFICPECKQEYKLFVKEDK